MGARAYTARMIPCEVATHFGHGVPPEVVRRFFDAIPDTLLALVGAQWTPAMEAAWGDRLNPLNWFATHPDQGAGRGDA